MARHPDKVIPGVTARQMLVAYLRTCITLAAVLCLVWLVVSLLAVVQSEAQAPDHLGASVWTLIAAVAAFAPTIGLILLLYLPGFLVLRGLLHLLALHGKASFATMGALNGIAICGVMDGRSPFSVPQAWPLVLTFAGLGAAAGAFQWRAERRIANRAANLMVEAP